MFYFAYSTDLNQKRMRERCPDSKPKFIASLHHYQLVFAGWSRQWRGGVASIKSVRDGRVLGAIYEVSEQCLRRLDKYEVGYNRLKVTVFDEDGEPLEAVTYIRTGQIEETTPAKEYLAIIQQGYRDWGLATIS